MDRFFVDELMKRCSEINLDKDNKQMISKVIEAYERICRFANLARREGLFELDEAKESLNLEDDTERLFIDQISYVLDGTEPILVKIMGANNYVTSNLNSYLGLICLMYVRGSMMIQAGNTITVVEMMLKSMMPKHILKELSRYESDNVGIELH